MRAGNVMRGVLDGAVASTPERRPGDRRTGLRLYRGAIPVTELPDVGLRPALTHLNAAGPTAAQSRSHM